MSDLDPFELAVLSKLLQGDHPALVALRKQVDHLKVSSRERTGVGFFTEFILDGKASAAQVPSERIRFSDVQASIDGLEHGAGFVLYVDNGFLRMLEGYSYDEPWPNQIREFTLTYSDPTRPIVAKEFG